MICRSVQRRAGPGDAAIVEIRPGDPLLGGQDVVDAFDEDRPILQFRPQHLIGEHDVRMIEYPSEICVHKSPGDAVSQAARQYRAPFVLEIEARFQIAVAD